MHILVTNDDGIHAPGLLALVQAVRAVAEVTVLAPEVNWSASGHVKTLNRPLRVKEVKLADGSPALASDGAPSDCVALALLGVVNEPIDLVLSGINPGNNVGHDLTYSGTVTAAMEAAIAGKPGVAVSLELPTDEGALMDFGPAAKVAQRIVRTLIQNAHPSSFLLNVNVPYLPEEKIKGMQVTRLGLRVYRDELVRRSDPRGRPYYWIGGDIPTGVPEEGTDIGALSEGYVSMTPIQLDFTAHTQLNMLREWKWQE